MRAIATDHLMLQLTVHQPLELRPLLNGQLQLWVT